jgi:hypothetical protein
VIINVPWEDNLGLGPVDDYLEVVDCDPASQAFYAPVNLNDPRLLAQDGLPPSEGNPQFHQQMVYAVARTTISHFERALGRRALWSPPGGRRPEPGGWVRRTFAHLSPCLKGGQRLLQPQQKGPAFRLLPRGGDYDRGEYAGRNCVFLPSHDIVAHETAHALLDGLHRRFVEPSNGDLWAFHEAFADILALFQQFTYL